MFKKTVWSIVLIAIIGVLIYGAINRTLAKTTAGNTKSEPVAIAVNHEQTTEVAGGQERGRGQSEKAGEEIDHASSGESYGRQGQNAMTEGQQEQDNGRGQSRQSEQAAAREAEHADMAWQTVQGKVVSLESDSMIVESASGVSVLVEGQSWSYAQEAGFVAELGDEVTLNGFDEGGEFKVGQLANDDSGQLVQLREQGGRPMWAGRGQGRSR